MLFTLRALLLITAVSLALTGSVLAEGPISPEGSPVSVPGGNNPPPPKKDPPSDCPAGGCCPEGSILSGECCLPAECPLGQIAMCGGAPGGSCVCPSGSEEFGAVGGNVVGGSADACVPSSCPDLIDCTERDANGVCVCKDPCEGRTIYSVDVKHGAADGQIVINQAGAPACFMNAINNICAATGFNNTVKRPTHACAEGLWARYDQILITYNMLITWQAALVAGTRSDFAAYATAVTNFNASVVQYRADQMQCFYDDYVGDDCAAAYAYERFVKGNMNLPVVTAGNFMTGWMFNARPKEFSFLMDDQCNPVSELPEQCKAKDLDINYYYSPISLLWSTDDIEESTTFVEFPVNPNSKVGVYSWKASGNAPLLVHDPEHTGVITSGAQLFGEYTFGKTHANGFAALSTMDTNGDGELLADELNDIALWFDTNRDGISQPGEVKSAEAVGLIRLFFTGETVDPETHDIRLEKGFERYENGSVKTGVAVDWFARYFSSKEEAVTLSQVDNKRVYGFKPEPLPSADAQVVTSASSLPKVQMPEPPVRQVVAKGKDVTGIWMWKTEGSSQDNKKMNFDGAIPKGILMLGAFDGRLKGQAAIEYRLPAPLNGASKRAVTIPLNGTVSGEGSKISFVLTGKNGFETASTATLSDDGSKLTGTSRAQVSRTKQGVPVYVDYTWVAERVVVRRKA